MTGLAGAGVSVIGLKQDASQKESMTRLINRYDFTYFTTIAIHSFFVIVSTTSRP